MRLPTDIKELIVDFKCSMELHERHQRVMCELEVNNFFRYVMRIYEIFLNISIT